MRGIIAASVTPRRAGESGCDLGALLEIVDFLCTAGVDGTLLFGSTGEFPVFDADDRARALSLAVKRSRCPIYANVSHATLEAAILLGEEAAECGAAGVLVMPPIYFRYDQESVREYMLRFLEAVGRWTPVYLYNIPLFTTAMEAATVSQLLAQGFSGIKDSSGDWDLLQEILASPAARGKSILTGSETLYQRARLAGALGAHHRADPLGVVPRHARSYLNPPAVSVPLRRERGTSTGASGTSARGRRDGQNPSSLHSSR